MSEKEAKRCSQCKEIKSLSLFYHCATAKDGLQSHCKACEYKRKKAYSKTPEAKATWKRSNKRARSKPGYPGKYRKYHLRTMYGLSVEAWDKLLIDQGGRCAICGNGFVGKEPFVDHNHGTKRVRGLLCHKCNSVLGYGRDNVVILRAAARYLEEKG
jgi:hypothetical protein